MEGPDIGVLVAGGTAASGPALLAELGRTGYDVTATWNSERGRERLAKELGDRVSLVRADLTVARDAEQAVAAVEQLDAVVCLVGGFAAGTKVHELDPKDFEGIIRRNLAPVFLLARAAMPRLAERGGAFVAFSSGAALRPFSGGAGYAVAKAAVLTLVQALHAEWRAEGVRCNAVLPGTIDTPANREAMPDADHSTWTSPEAIAQVVRFLVSEESAAVSGAVVPV